jgi:opacity protein-like surface antigen
MKRFITTMVSALMLSPVLALAQEEEPVEVVEEAPAEEAAPVEEAAPAEGDPALAQDMAAQEAPAEEAEEEPTPGEGSGYVDAYWLPTTVADVGGLDDNGDGMGGRAHYQFWKFLAASAEYTFRDFSDADTDVTDMRAGLGAVTQNNSGDKAGLFLQWEQVESDFDDLDGFALHGRWSNESYEWLTFYIDLGYGRLEGAEKYSSREANLGLLFKFGGAGIFADWRRTAYDGKDSNTEATVEDVRVGARLAFGG